MLKLSISPKKQNIDEGFGSQDQDQLFSNENDKEIEEFEKSLEKFEDELKENQSAMKSLNKKITSMTNKKPCKKVSDFFKPKDVKAKGKKMQTRNSVMTEENNNNVKSENAKVPETDNDKEKLGKRSNPFSK